jgi:hypothetical protein
MIESRSIHKTNGSGSGSRWSKNIPYYGSTDPDPHPQHWVRFIIFYLKYSLRAATEWTPVSDKQKKLKNMTDFATNIKELVLSGETKG